MPQVSGMEILKYLREKSHETTVVMMTAYATVENAVEAMKMGAFDYIIKPFSPDQIEVIVGKVEERKSLVNENRYLRSELEQQCGFGEIIGQSDKMQEVFSMIKKVANSRATVLITGESGTGKELVARAIHYNSSRADKPFIKLNCAAVPEGLFESELFGHEKGAFTSANAKRLGRFELSDKGTLFLDEISEIPLNLQSKLLRVLQEREFERVGGTKPLNVDVRIICTSNRNLEEAIAKKQFREDLFFRLNVIPIVLPPLRDRLDDVPYLAEYFVNRYCSENRKEQRTISKMTVTKLMAYSWPGNVRELQNVIERAIVLDYGPIIQPEHISIEQHSTLGNQESDESQEIIDETGIPLWEMERRLILKTLKSLGGNRGMTANALKISVRTLRNKLNQYREMNSLPV
jgi:two-component system response regulator AtoC